MKEILEKIDSDPSRYLEEGDSNGCSPLLQACTAGDVGLVNALLDRGANIFSKDTSWAWGALHYAVWKNHVGMIRTNWNGLHLINALSV